MGRGLNLSLQAICICFPFQTAQEVDFQLDGRDEELGICFESGFLAISSYGLRRHLSSGRGRLDIAGVVSTGRDSRTANPDTFHITDNKSCCTMTLFQ